MTAGLIDGVAYDDELAPHLGDGARQIKARRYLLLREPGWFGRRFARRGARVGIVEVRGSIVVEAPVALGRVAAADRMAAMLAA